jgi:hypothetical protein
MPCPIPKKVHRYQRQQVARSVEFYRAVSARPGEVEAELPSLLRCAGAESYPKFLRQYSLKARDGEIEGCMASPGFDGERLQSHPEPGIAAMVEGNPRRVNRVRQRDRFPPLALLFQGRRRGGMPLPSLRALMAIASFTIFVLRTQWAGAMN